MKIHIFSKILFIIILSFTFIYCLILEKYLYLKTPNIDIINKLNGIDKSTIDGKMTQYTYEFGKYLSTLSDNTIIIYTIVFTILLVMFMDLLVGVGRRSPLFK